MIPDPLFTTVQRALAGQYSLEREIGRGGMGVVYLAREVELARLVALKVLPLDLAGIPGTRERFLREARTAAALSHPHIVPIHRVGEAGEIVYFSMMFVDGETLGERLRARGPLPPSAAMRMLREVSQALAYAHGRGIVHRDIKPDNILLDRESGRALVTDFGIAGTTEDRAVAETPIHGTLHFMSPEQAVGLPLDGRSDLYSLGVVAHIALSGRLPSRHAPLASTAGVHTPPAGSLALAAPSTPRHLCAAIDRALALDPAERFPTAEAFAGAVDARAMVQATLPAPIRNWLLARDPWTLPYAAWSAGFLSMAVADWSHDHYVGVIYLVAGLIPLIPAGLFEVRRTRHLLDAGYSLDDVRAALPAWESERREEIGIRDAGRPGWVAPVARTAAYGAVAALAVSLFGGGFDLPSAIELVLFIACAASLPLLSAFGIPLLPSIDGMIRKPLRQRLWDTALGRSLERLLARGKRSRAPANAFRATELVLGSAVDDLWRSLPAAFRERFADVPDIAKRLEGYASRARTTLAHLDDLPANDGEAIELAPARARARHELESAVTSLESIRLDLLRLIGGDTSLAATTTVLDAARRVDSDLKRMHDAQREVERVVRPIGLDLGTHSPV
jgi:serine/threonine-protein kinase